MTPAQTVVVLGATGATGKLLTHLLLERGHQVKTVVRSLDRLPASVRNHTHLDAREGSLLELNDHEFHELLEGCDAVASCLGHNITLKGIFGKPRRLVTDAVKRTCRCLEDEGSPVKFVLMNTIANRNRDLNEPVSLAHRTVIAILRVVLPPHPDNEQAADFLRTEIGQDHPTISWAAVRPDGLIDEHEASAYSVHPSPLTSLFKPRTTSRINVAHFMAELVVNRSLWEEWKGRMPVIYNELS